MCLLIHRPKGSGIISPEWQTDFWNRNSDGFGAWWVNGNTIETHKTLDKTGVADIIKFIEEHDIEAGMHWRMATHGDTSLDNIHPFVADENNGRNLCVIAHNGVLYDWASDGVDEKNTGAQEYYGVGYHYGKQRIGPSDTLNFVNKAFKPMLSAFGVQSIFSFEQPGRIILDSLIGTSNRLLLTHHREGFSRVGRHWVDWKQMHMSNTYAWSYNKREWLNPTEPPPFCSTQQTGTKTYLPQEQVGPGTCVIAASTDNGNGSKSAERSAKVFVSRLADFEEDDEIEDKREYLDSGNGVLNQVATRVANQIKLLTSAHQPKPTDPSQAGTTEELIDALQGMDFMSLLDWCRQEPEEAACLLQTLMWETEGFAFDA